ncbi:MAG: DUF2339 domain-containing protein [Candidatus Komeilibacteria bacterium]|jgi:uncharacterized membrane protein|nr:DUF2339 domain-containing protein [Candidatus Komeilibacteria bacterium]MBT4447626.1 DUF2339 domain-containing protein [Candidatus Komeilibacteria bacterium]
MFYLLGSIVNSLGILPVIAVVILFVMVANLKKRVKNLELNSSARPSVPTEQPAVQADIPSDMQTQDQQLKPDVPQALAPADVPSVISKPSVAGNVFHWIREEWLFKLGALLLLLGFGWFVNTNNWLGPMGSTLLGVFVGTVLLILGAWRIKNDLHQGNIFLVLGSTVILITVYAARNLHGLFTPLTALGLSFLSTAFVAFVSVKRKSIGLAVAALILAALAPLLVGGSGGGYVELFTYLTVVILGVIWVVILTGWRPLTLLALIMVGFHSLPVLTTYSIATKSTILLFIYGLASLFYIFNTIGLLKIKDRSTKADVITAALNGMLLLVWILAAAQKEWQSLIIIAWMLVFAFGAFMIFKKTNKKDALYIYTGIGTAMLAAATTVELDGAVLTIAYTIESAVISLIMFSAMKNHITGQKYSLLLLGPILFAFNDIERFDRSRTVFNEYFFSILVLALCLFAVGFAYRYFGRNFARKGFFGKLYIGQIILGSAYIYILLWHSLQNSFDNRSTAAMVAIVIYTIIGLITNIYGKLMHQKVFLFYGGTMLVLVVMRLLLVDIGQMDQGRRIMTFFFIGFLLIAAAFGTKKKQISNNLEN